MPRANKVVAAFNGTNFYAEAGGQKSDRGRVYFGENEMQISQVQEEEGVDSGPALRVSKEGHLLHWRPGLSRNRRLAPHEVDAQPHGHSSPQLCFERDLGRRRPDRWDPKFLPIL